MFGNEEVVVGLLMDVGLVTQADVDAARETAGHDGGVIDGLLKQGAVTQLDVTKAIANTAGLEFIDEIRVVPDEVVKAVPAEIAKRYRVFPIQFIDNVLRIAVVDPFDVQTIDDLQVTLNQAIEPVVAPEPVIEKALSEYYGEIKDTTRTAGFDATGVDANSPDAPIIKMVQLLIVEAYRMRASDIHVEPLERRLRVRYRIDGEMDEQPDPPKALQAAIISRLKIMSNMSIAEKRLPQDGRIQLTVGDKQLDLRVSTVPTVHGESIVMRILDKSGLKLGLPELGFFSDDQVIMERILGLADGIFLVTGPTGSGKTTTLYACLNYLNKPDRKIITVEDPVEYMLSGINQVQVNAEVEMTFPRALRAMLRQAPNIVMVGEIRDPETGAIAIQAALTGHLVFSTLHTNDAPSAITRLVDLGVKPFLVASALRAVMAQRLIRAMHPQHSEQYEPSEADLKALGLTPSQVVDATFMRPRADLPPGVSGYKGRKGIFEIFQLNEEIRRMIADKVGVIEMRARARQLGMRTLREDGVRKVLAGITTVSEVVAATMGDKA